MRIASIDLGDRHIGIALSDATRLIASPFITITPEKLDSFLIEFIRKQSVTIILVGHPKTLRGTKSEQTLKVEKEFERLKNLFKDIQWQLIDERLSSKHANNLKKATTIEEKIKSHAIVAAMLLDSYLQFLDNDAF